MHASLGPSVFPVEETLSHSLMRLQASFRVPAIPGVCPVLSTCNTVSRGVNQRNRPQGTGCALRHTRPLPGLAWACARTEPLAVSPELRSVHLDFVWPLEALERGHVLLSQVLRTVCRPIFCSLGAARWQALHLHGPSELRRGCCRGRGSTPGAEASPWHRVVAPKRRHTSTSHSLPGTPRGGQLTCTCACWSRDVLGAGLRAGQDVGSCRTCHWSSEPAYLQCEASSAIAAADTGELQLGVPKSRTCYVEHKLVGRRGHIHPVACKCSNVSSRLLPEATASQLHAPHPCT